MPHDVILTPSKNANNRTKNRIKEHGPRFTLLKEGDFIKTGWTLFRAPDGWLGWLVTSSFEVTSAE